METSATDVLGEDVKLFKSYYVVWKPTHRVQTCFTQRQFKSYYVVWKHPLPQSIGLAHQSV